MRFKSDKTTYEKIPCSTKLTFYRSNPFGTNCELGVRDSSLKFA